VLRAIFGRDLDRLTRQLGAKPLRGGSAGNRHAICSSPTGSARSPKSVAQLIAQRRAEPEEHFDYLAMLMMRATKESGAPDA